MGREGEQMERIQSCLSDQIGVAVDLGSTTIAVICWDMIKNREIVAFSFSNPQSCYGADVITRIRHCVDRKEMLEKLGNLIRITVKEKLNEYLQDSYKNVKEIVVTGNPTMIHIWRGLSVDGFATAPFTPVNLDYAKTEEVNQPIEIFPPGLSAFVGSDILVGLEYLKAGKQKPYDLLIDLGTNGEMVLLNSKEGYATSTACGTVFDTAISGARYGSDCIKAISNCIKNRLIDANGRITDVYFEKGIEIDKNFVIKQQNVRNFQLAKGAIYAGILSLLEKAKINYEDVDKIYICGGLGFYLDNRDAFTVKLLPKEFNGKIVCCGNSSLQGALHFLISSVEDREKIVQEYQQIRNRTKSFELANFEHFQEIYMQSLNF